MEVIKNYLKSLPQRWIVTVMSMMAVTIAYTMRSSLSMTMMQMVKPVVVNASKYVQKDLICPMPPLLPDDRRWYNGTTPVQDQSGRFAWDEATQGMILSAFYYGYIITHIPGGWLAQRFGGKFPTAYTITSSSVLTLLTPTAAKMGSKYLITLRFVQGLGEGILFPALCTLLVQWAPPLEKGKLSTLVFSGVAIGQICANLFSAIIIDCVPGGWPNVFYCFGTIALIWLTVWLSIVYNDPISNPLISTNEYKYLNDTIGCCQRKNHLAPTPWSKILSTPAVWALIAVEIGFDWGNYTVASDLPKYMNDVLHFTAEENGFLSSTPYLAQWTMASLSGIAGDYVIEKKYLTITRVRKICAVIGTVGPGLGVMCASFVGCHKFAATFFFNSGMLLMGFSYPSIRINALDLSPNYSPSIMALVNGIGCLSGMASPYVVGLLTPDRTVYEWRSVFWIMFGTLLVADIIFSLFGSGELQPWDSEESTSSSTEDKSGESNDVNQTTQSIVPTTTKNIIN